MPPAAEAPAMVARGLSRRGLLAGLAPLPLAAPALAEGRPELDVAAWLDAWEAVLRRRVDAMGRVDFAGLAAAPGPLPEVTRFIATADPRSRPELFPGPAHRLSYYLNAYNALAMGGIVARGIPESLGLAGRYGFFVNTSFQVGGRGISLKALEDEVIRPLGEERVHFALNCMVRGCPRLPREAFRPERLEAQLAAAAREFCSSGYQVRPDPASRSVFVSQIFEFYTKDFLARAPSLPAYIDRWRPQPLPAGATLRFFPYDWTVNRQPGGGGAAG